MAKVQFIRGTSDILQHTDLKEGALYVAVDKKELLTDIKNEDGKLVRMNLSLGPDYYNEEEFASVIVGVFEEYAVTDSSEKIPEDSEWHYVGEMLADGTIFKSPNPILISKSENKQYIWGRTRIIYRDGAETTSTVIDPSNKDLQNKKIVATDISYCFAKDDTESFDDLEWFTTWDPLKVNTEFPAVYQRATIVYEDGTVKDTDPIKISDKAPINAAGEVVKNINSYMKFYEGTDLEEDPPYLEIGASNLTTEADNDYVAGRFTPSGVEFGYKYVIQESVPETETETQKREVFEKISWFDKDTMYNTNIDTNKLSVGKQVGQDTDGYYILQQEAATGYFSIMFMQT